METINNQALTAANLDERGFMTEPSTWTPAIAEILAMDHSIDKLTDDQWKIIQHIRQYYLEFGIVPPVRKLSRETGRTQQQYPIVRNHSRILTSRSRSTRRQSQRLSKQRTRAKTRFGLGRELPAGDVRASRICKI